jgi:topoisomerase IV subunit A
MARGKGNRIISIPSARLKDGQGTGGGRWRSCRRAARCSVHAGRSFKGMGPAEWAEYEAERGRRGHKLPRGYQKVDRLEVQV